VRETWWILDNVHGGMHYTQAATPADARRRVRARLVEAARSEGMTLREARHWASTYGVGVIAAGCTRDEALDAAEAHNAYEPDHGPADALRARYLASKCQAGPARRPDSEA